MITQENSARPPPKAGKLSRLVGEGRYLFFKSSATNESASRGSIIRSIASPAFNGEFNVFNLDCFPARVSS